MQNSTENTRSGACRELKLESKATAAAATAVAAGGVGVVARAEGAAGWGAVAAGWQQRQQEGRRGSSNINNSRTGAKLQPALATGASFEGAGRAVAPPQGKEKNRKKERKRKKKEKIKEKKKKERKKGTVNNVQLIHIKCCFFQFFNSPVPLKNNKKNLPPQEKS